MRLKEIKNPIAYFSAEFAIDNELPTYAGGLGILAADISNQAALEHYPFVGIGILYKGKGFLQIITSDGRAETKDSEFDHDTSFLRPTTKDGKPLIFGIKSNGQDVKVKAYHVRLSDTTILFFLSTDVDGNPPEWVSDMDALYGGDMESQIRQQILLGVGGVKLLEELDITPHIYHLNEGRPGFAIWEITRNIMRKKQIDFDSAWKEAKDRIVYTNHTLIPAGNPTYPLNIVKKYSFDFANDMGVENDMLIKDGIDKYGNFNTTLFALNVSKRHNAVSRSHFELAKAEWPNFEWTYITNGIYLPRWQDSDFRDKELDDKELWNLHLAKKEELMKTTVQRTGFGYDTNKLVITWARRLADYKQPLVIFSDLARLKKILQNTSRPIQLLFAGNSHTADTGSKSIIEKIIKIFSTELSGSAIFIPNYNISLANHLTSGSDVWLNTPQGDMEACGTSGMKAISNGVLNCTVLNGWTYEIDWNGVGFVLDSKNTAESFYETIENQVAPLYYQRDNENLPSEWIKRMRASIEISKTFSMERTLREYKVKLYDTQTI